MSDFLPESYGNAADQIVKPAVDAISDSDRKLIQKIFSRPEIVPEKFLAYIVDYLAVNQPQIPISQIFGFSQFVANSSFVETLTTTTSLIYVDKGGPSLSGLPDGKYVVFHGASCKSDAGTPNYAGVSLEINGVAATDTNLAYNANPGFTSVARFTDQTLNNAGSNSIAVRYRVSGGTGSFEYRQLIALRYANL